MERLENLTGREAAKFIRGHKGKIYVDVTCFGGEGMIRIPAVKSDLAYGLEQNGDSDGIDIFTDNQGLTVLGYTYI